MLISTTSQVPQLTSKLHGLAFQHLNVLRCSALSKLIFSLPNIERKGSITFCFLSLFWSGGLLTTLNFSVQIFPNYWYLFEYFRAKYWHWYLIVPTFQRCWRLGDFFLSWRRRASWLAEHSLWWTKLEWLPPHMLWYVKYKWRQIHIQGNYKYKQIKKDEVTIDTELSLDMIKWQII